MGSIQAHTVPKGKHSSRAILGLGDVVASIDTIIIKEAVIKEATTSVEATSIKTNSGRNACLLYVLDKSAAARIGTE